MTDAGVSAVARLARRVRRAAADPGAAIRRLIGAGGAPAAAPAPPPPPPDPLAPFATMLARGRAAGLDRPLLFLSFDCDTDLDFTAALEVKRFLDGLGVKATWAVPGCQIRRGAATYRAIAASGDEFMNHGELPHTAWAGDRYVSITWYHEMEPAAVEADIAAGDATIREVLGVTPRGFRAPHFGHYGEPEQLALVHGAARRLGYAYCSTTLPAYGLAHGSVVDLGGLVELPTTGSLEAPTSTLDSWSWLTDRRDYALGDTYARLMADTVDALVAARAPILLSWYADPSHVAGQEPFERAMRHLVAAGVPSLRGVEAAALARA